MGVVIPFRRRTDVRKIDEILMDIYQMRVDVCSAKVDCCIGVLKLVAREYGGETARC